MDIKNEATMLMHVSCITKLPLPQLGSSFNQKTNSRINNPSLEHLK